MTDCIFCKISQGIIPSEKIYEDEKIFVIRDIRPKAPVHLLIIPHEHIPTLNNTTDVHADLLGYMMISLKNFAKTQNIDSFRTIINTGAGSGQEVFHLHFHLLGEKTALPDF
jgi:histidine triad (HIT) family protein